MWISWSSLRLSRLGEAGFTGLLKETGNLRWRFRPAILLAPRRRRRLPPPRAAVTPAARLRHRQVRPAYVRQAARALRRNGLEPGSKAQSSPIRARLTATHRRLTRPARAAITACAASPLRATVPARADVAKPVDAGRLKSRNKTNESNKKPCKTSAFWYSRNL